MQFNSRYGRVQSVKLLPRGGKEETGEMACTVAFMDIKSASKAHTAEHKLDDRTLTTEYYEPAAIPSSSSPPNTSAGYATTSPSSTRFPNGHSSAEEHGNFTERFYDRTNNARVPEGEYIRRAGYHDNNRGRNRDRGFRNGPYNSLIERHRTVNNTWTYDGTRYNNSSSTGQANDTGYNTTPTTDTSDRRSEQSTKKKTKSRSGSRTPSPSGSTSSRSPSRSRSRSSSSSSSSSGSRETSSTGSPKSRRLQSNNPSHQPVVHSEDRRPLAICVRNLPLRSSDTSLKDGLFHEYKKHGKVTWVKVVGQSSERHAIVCFKKPEDVEKALEVSYDKLFFGCKIEVAPYQGYDVEDNDLRPYEAEIDEFHPKATRTLFIGNLEKDVTASDLRKHFDQFGEIIEIDIKKQGVVSSYAFCQYSDIVSVVKAIRTMDGEHLNNNRIKLGFGKSMPTPCVWVDGVSESVTDKYLSNQFDPFGIVSHIFLDRDKGQALIFFDQVINAQTAVNKMRGVNLRGRKIQVDFASRECQEAFFENLEKQGLIFERPGFEERRDSTSRSFESLSSNRFSRYDTPTRPRTASYSSRTGAPAGQCNTAAIPSPGTPGSATPRGTGSRSRLSRYEYYDQNNAEYPDRHFRSYDEYSQGSGASHEDSYDHEYVYHESPSHLETIESRLQTGDHVVIPFAQPDIRNLQKERVLLLEQLEECPSSGDELISPKKRLKLEHLDGTITSDVIIEANRDHRKVMEVRRSSDASLKHLSRRPSVDGKHLGHERGSYLPHAVCKRRKTAGSDSGRVHHYESSESVGGSRPGTPLCDERPEHFAPSEPRRIPREREGPLTLPLPRFASQVMGRGSVSVAGIKGQKENILSSPPPAVTSPRISNPKPPSPMPVPPPASPPPRPPSLSSNSSDSDGASPSPSLDERIKSLDEKYEKWSGSRALSTAGIDALAKLDQNRERFKFRHKLLDLKDLKEVQPSEIVKSVMAKRSVFDEDSKRLENVGEKYEPKDYNLFPRTPVSVQTTVPATTLCTLPLLKVCTNPPPKTPTMLSPRSSGASLTPAKGLQYPFPTHPPMQPSPSSTSPAPTTPQPPPPPPTSTTPRSTHGDNNRLKPCANAPSDNWTPSKVCVNRSVPSSVVVSNKTSDANKNIPPTTSECTTQYNIQLEVKCNKTNKVTNRRDSTNSETNNKSRRNSETGSSSRKAEDNDNCDSTETDRLEKVRLENERLEREAAERERLEKERMEKERLEQEEKERLEKERLEKEKQEKERRERERKEREERERREREEKERREREEREAREREEKERREREEKERREREEKERRDREEKERREREEKERREREEKERREREEKERREREEKERREREERERREREEKDRREREELLEREKQEKDRRERREKEDRERREREEREKREKEELAEKERRREKEDERKHKEDNHEKHRHRENHSETRHRDNNVDKPTKDNHISRKEENKNLYIYRDAERRKDSVKENRDNNLHEKTKNLFNEIREGKDRPSVEHLSDSDKKFENKDPSRRKERNNSLPASLGVKRRMSSHESIEGPDDPKKLKLSQEHRKISERRDSKDGKSKHKNSSSTTKSSSYDDKSRHNHVKEGCDEKKKEREREREERHKSKQLKAEKLKQKSKNREKESSRESPSTQKSRESPTEIKSPIMDKEFLARLDLVEVEKQKQVQQRKDSREGKPDDLKRSEERKKEHKPPREGTPKSSDERSKHIKRERIRKLTNSSDNSDSDEPKKHSIFDIVDDEPAYISMYDKVKARSCKNMQKQEEEKRQEKIKAKFSQLKQSRAKREEKKRSTSWDEDSDSDIDKSDIGRRKNKMLIASSDDDGIDTRKQIKKEIFTDSDSDRNRCALADTSDDDHIKNIQRKSSKSQILCESSNDGIYDMLNNDIRGMLNTRIFSDSEENEFADTEEKYKRVKEEYDEKYPNKKEKKKISELNQQIFGDSNWPEIKEEKYSNSRRYDNSSADESSMKTEVRKKHKKKQKRQKNSVSSEEGGKLDSESVASDGLEKSKNSEKKKQHSKKDKKRDKTKDENRQKKSKKSKSESKDFRREGKMENIFGSLSDDSEGHKDQDGEHKPNFMERFNEENAQSSVYASDSDGVAQNDVQDQERIKLEEKDRLAEKERFLKEEHRKRKEKKRREKEKRMREEQLNNENSMDYVDLGKQVEDNIKDEDGEAEVKIKTEIEESNAEDVFRFTEASEPPSELRKDGGDRKEVKEKKKKRKKSKDEKQRHHHHHHHDKNKIKSPEIVIKKEEEIKVEVDSIFDTPSNKSSDSLNMSISPQIREAMLSPIPKTPVSNKEKKRDKFIPGFGVEIDEKIHENAVKSISEFEAPKTEPAISTPEPEVKVEKTEPVEEKPRVVISQEETEDAVAALLGESFGSGQFGDLCFNEPQSPEQNNEVVEENVQDDEEMRKAVQSLNSGELEIKPETPQSENDLQIDTDTEEQEEVGIRYDQPPRTPEMIDFSQPPKTPDIPSYFRKDVVDKSMPNIGSPPSLTPIKAPHTTTNLESVKRNLEAQLEIKKSTPNMPVINETPRTVISQQWAVNEHKNLDPPAATTPKQIPVERMPPLAISTSAVMAQAVKITSPTSTVIKTEDKIDDVPPLKPVNKPSVPLSLHNMPAQMPYPIPSQKEQPKISPANIVMNRLPITPVMVSKPMQPTTLILPQAKVAQAQEMKSSTDNSQDKDKARVLYKQYPNFQTPRMLMQRAPPGLILPARPTGVTNVNIFNPSDKVRPSMSEPPKLISTSYTLPTIKTEPPKLVSASTYTVPQSIQPPSIIISTHTSTTTAGAVKPFMPVIQEAPKLVSISAPVTQPSIIQTVAKSVHPNTPVTTISHVIPSVSLRKEVESVEKPNLLSVKEEPRTSTPSPVIVQVPKQEDQEVSTPVSQAPVTAKSPSKPVIAPSTNPQSIAVTKPQQILVTPKIQPVVTAKSPISTPPVMTPKPVITPSIVTSKPLTTPPVVTSKPTSPVVITTRPQIVPPSSNVSQNLQANIQPPLSLQMRSPVSQAPTKPQTVTPKPVLTATSSASSLQLFTSAPQLIQEKQPVIVVTTVQPSLCLSEQIITTSTQQQVMTPKVASTVSSQVIVTSTPQSVVTSKTQAVITSRPPQIITTTKSVVFTSPPQQQQVTVLATQPQQSKVFQVQPQQQAKVFTSQPQQQQQQQPIAFTTQAQQAKVFITQSQQQAKVFTTQSQQQAKVFTTQTQLQQQQSLVFTKQSQQPIVFVTQSQQKPMAFTTQTQPQSMVYTTQSQQLKVFTTQIPQQQQQMKVFTTQPQPPIVLTTMQSQIPMVYTTQSQQQHQLQQKMFPTQTHPPPQQQQQPQQKLITTQPQPPSIVFTTQSQSVVATTQLPVFTTSESKTTVVSSKPTETVTTTAVTTPKITVTPPAKPENPAETPQPVKAEIKHEIKPEEKEAVKEVDGNVEQKPKVHETKDEPNESISVIKEIEKFDEEKADTESVQSDVSKERLSADIKEDPLDSKEDSDYWSAKEVNIDSVIKKVDALCSADELSDRSSEIGKDDWIEEKGEKVDEKEHVPVVESKLEEGDAGDESMDDKDAEVEVAARGRRGGRGRGRRGARGGVAAVERGGMQTRRGKVVKEVPVSRGRGGGRAGRPKIDRKVTKSESEDIYEFRDDSDESQNKDRPRLILTIKSPTVANASSNGNTAIVKEITPPTPVKPVEVKEEFASPANTRKSRRLQERDISRNTVDDTIEDVVKNTVLTRAAAAGGIGARRSTRQVAAVKTTPQVEVTKKSPRGGGRKKDRRASETTDDSSEEKSAKPEVVVTKEETPVVTEVEVPKPVTVPEQPKVDTVREKPHEGLKAAVLRRVKGEMNQEPMTLIDPVTGLLTPMRECEEGRYIPLGGQANAKAGMLVQPQKIIAASAVKVDDSTTTTTTTTTAVITQQTPQSVVVKQQKPQTLKAHVLGKAAQHVPTVSTPPASFSPKPVTQNLNINVSVGNITPSHVSPRMNIPMSANKGMQGVKVIQQPASQNVLAHPQNQIFQQVTKAPIVSTMGNPQMAHLKQPSPQLKQQPQQLTKSQLMKPHLVQQQQPIGAASPLKQHILSGSNARLMGKTAMEPPKAEVSTCVLVPRSNASPQNQQRHVLQAGIQVPTYEASLHGERRRSPPPAHQNSPSPQGEGIAHYNTSGAVPMRPHHDMSGHYMHPPHVMYQYLRQQPYHLSRSPIVSGGLEKTGDGQEGEEAPVTSPPLELRRPGSVGLGLPSRQSVVPHSLQSPHDRTTDSPQVGQVYNMHSSRVQYHPSRYYEPGEPPPAHRPLTSHALGSERPMSHMTGLGTPDRPLSTHSALASHMGSLGTPERPLSTHLPERPLSTHIPDRPISAHLPDRSLTSLGLGAGLGAAGNLMGAVARHIGAEAPASQRGLQAATPPHASQVPPQAESLLMLLKQYPLMWQGLLALKNDQAAVQMYFVSGNDTVAKMSLPKNIDGSTLPLRIFQRMRLEPPQVEGVARKMQMENEHCMLLALPCGHDHMDVLKQSTNLTHGFITYLQQKQAAGIVNVAAPGTTQPPAYVVHIFPSCDFVNENLRRIAPSLLERVADIAHLLIVITTV